MGVTDGTVLNSVKSRGRNGSPTVSAEALGEGGGVGDVVGRVLLRHQGDHGAVCHLHTKGKRTT